jgi:hypothetical protein
MTGSIRPAGNHVGSRLCPLDDSRDFSFGSEADISQSSIDVRHSPAARKLFQSDIQKMKYTNLHRGGRRSKEIKSQTASKNAPYCPYLLWVKLGGFPTVQLPRCPECDRQRPQCCMS